MTPLFAPAAALAGREVTRFLRQRQHVVGAIGQPLLFWAFLGTGLSPSFRAEAFAGVSYLEYFYPGVLVMMMLFSSIFASITVIEDRQAGFLQGVVVAPVARLAIVLGKVGGAVVIALVQCLLFLCAAPFLGFELGSGQLGLIVLALLLGAGGFAALGFWVAWASPTTGAFHAVMMVGLMPLWLLSGALFPLQGLPAWLHWPMQVNPVSHALAVLRWPFYHAPAEALVDPGYLMSLGVTVAWVALFLVLAARRVTGTGA